MTSSVDKERVDIVYLDFTNIFNIVSLLAKLVRYRLDKCTTKWVEDYLNHQTQKAVITGTKSNWQLIKSGALQI